jgi:repressor of nif and glnA expression
MRCAFHGFILTLCGNASLNIDYFGTRAGVFRYPLMAGLLQFDNRSASGAQILRWLITPITAIRSQVRGGKIDVPCEALG